MRRLGTWALLGGLAMACGSAPDDLTSDGVGGASAAGGSPPAFSPPPAGGAPFATGGSPPVGGAGAQGGAGAGGSGGLTAGGADAGPEIVVVPPPAPVGCVTDVTAGVHHVDCDGVGYDLTVPEVCIGRSCGLIVDVHGGTMSGPMEDKNTNLSALGQEHGYFVITPSAASGLWNGAVDDPKILAFMNQVIEAFHVDLDRIHMTGMSQGGYMSWRFMCQHTDLFASVAPAAAAGAANISIEVGCTFTGTDVPSGEVDILYMHGTQDGLVNYPNAALLRDTIIAFYGAGPGQLIASDASYRRTRYELPGGHVFEYIDHDYVSDSAVGLPPLAGVAIKGHCFPGSDDLSITLPNQLMSFGCNPPSAFKWGEEVIRFFEAHPKR